MPSGVETQVTKRNWAKIARFLTKLLGFGTVGLGLAVIGPLLLPITASTGDEQLSQVVVMPFLGLTVANLAAGWIAERLDVRGTLCAGATGFAGAGVIGFSGPPAPLLLATCWRPIRDAVGLHGLYVVLAVAAAAIGAAFLLRAFGEGRAAAQERSRPLGAAQAVSSDPCAALACAHFVSSQPNSSKARP